MSELAEIEQEKRLADELAAQRHQKKGWLCFRRGTRRSPSIRQDTPLVRNMGATFVLHKLHYSLRKDAKHSLLDHIRIALYSFIVLNGRQTMGYFGLEGLNTMEIAVVRYL